MAVVLKYPKEGRPIIPFKLVYGKKELNITAILDSGGDKSFLQPELAKILLGSRHLRMPPCEQMKGISGMSKGVIFKLDVCISDGNESYTVEKVPFFIPRGDTKGFNIVGREVFFSKFDITFKHKIGEVVLIPIVQNYQN